MTKQTTENQRLNEWLIEQVAAWIAQTAPWSGFDVAVTSAHAKNDSQDWAFGGPLAFSGRKLQPHERERWTRYSRLWLESEDFDRAVSMARGFLSTDPI